MTIDLNTLISSAVLGLSCWTLYTVHEMAKTAAAREEHDKSQDLRIDENRARIIDVEDRVGGTELDIVRLQRGR